MKTRLWTGLIIGGLLVTGSAGAADKEKPLPKDLPPYGPTQVYVPPAVDQSKLPNGLAVWLVPVAGFPKITFVLAVRGGYAADPKDRPGIAELLASAVTEGTKTASAKAIAERLQGCGGDLTAQAGADSIELTTGVLAEKADSGLRVLADVAQNAAFADDEVQIVKQQESSSLQANEAEPRFLARRALYRTLFGEHPYSVISPTQESIQKSHASDLKAEYTRRFRPDESVLVIVGAFDKSRMMSLVQSEFGSWQKPPAPSDVSIPPVNPSVRRTVTYVPRPNSVQTSLYIGGFGPKASEPDFEATHLANAIYGGMFGSRLVLNIREDKGYTYSPHANIVSRQATGLLVTGADVRNPVTGASFNEISYELNRIATTAPEPEEVARAKRYMIGSLAVQLQSQADLAERLATYWIDSLTPQDLAEEGEKIEKVSSSDVQAAGRKYFPMWRMTTVAVGEEKVIREELAPFGLEFSKAQ